MSEVKATVSLPVALLSQVQEQIQAGRFSDLDSLVVEALRRYLESHRDELREHFIRKDLEWGLHLHTHRPLLQKMICQHQGHHRLCHRHDSGRDGRVVPAPES